MENNDKNPIGRLFGCVDYYNLEQLESFNCNMNDIQTKFMTVKALEYAFEKGVFSLSECEIVSKCVRELSKSNNESE
jgi:hypothetical protein